MRWLRHFLKMYIEKKNNLVFQIKAFLHKRSDKLAVKKDKELAEGIKSCAQVSNEIY